MYPKGKRHTELVQEILSRGYQLNSGVILATRVLDSGEISDKGEADVTKEIISLVTAMWKFRRIISIKDGGDNYAGIKSKCKVYYNEEESSLPFWLFPTTPPIRTRREKIFFSLMKMGQRNS